MILTHFNPEARISRRARVRSIEGIEYGRGWETQRSPELLREKSIACSITNISRLISFL